MACRQCAEQRARLNYALKTLRLDTRKCPRLRLIGLYIGPNGLWHGIRFHFWSFYIGVTFKWRQ